MDQENQAQAERFVEESFLAIEALEEEVESFAEAMRAALHHITALEGVLHDGGIYPEMGCLRHMGDPDTGVCDIRDIDDHRESIRRKGT